MSRRLRVPTTLLVLALTIISTVFTILAATSKTWSRQAYYFDPPADSGLPSELGMNETTPLCVWERSPFYRCGVPRVYANMTCEIGNCTFYPPNGYNQTSCRSAAEFGVRWNQNVDANGLLGGATECQEIHYAGNLQVAASTFLGIGLLCAILVSAISLAITVTDAEEASSRRQRRALSSVVAMLLAFLYIGSLLQLLAQFFGVLGLTVNATPNTSNPKDDQYESVANFVSGGWMVGKGLSTYATLAWASAIVAATVTTMAFSRPRPTKLF